MGGALRRIATNFNVESRAHRLLDQQKPRPAPKHPKTADKIAQYQRENPQILDQQKRKDENLLGMLKDVKVMSQEVAGKRLMNEADAAESKKKPRPLPQNRKSNPGSPSVFLEPDEIPEGRLSVEQALELLARHKRNKKEYPAERLAQDFKMDLEDTKNILEYFQSFKVIPVIDGKDVPRIKGS
ncbi:NADH dehydrogenase [ubiquinone] 1 alpha subcomplex assembly factor 4-like isoform X2 [Lytechinus variegatus]|uniref:NADH dehydrogenase [ubiquinone] 1 alpha subcomplex assembly factor 4-like isoform X2 n=1 Tax=Lytechinus variegatus TaxID=7654 RepID=UPI001BB15216|nr:NADH dehydrogenase [ubiquinone] 1 alpha subcomplex assembly factor 4-like isoform X2 [Lytechinus variegatus]